jgi:limonene-1,2-epoxide hydrolase
MTQATTNLDSATRAFYGALDANDPGTFERHLAPDAVFAFNDVDPVTGVQQISDFVGAWKSNFRSVTHDLAGITVDPERERAGIEIVVSYVFPDDREVRVKGCSFLDFSADRITGWRVYVDTTRLS